MDSKDYPFNPQSVFKLSLSLTDSIDSTDIFRVSVSLSDSSDVEYNTTTDLPDHTDNYISCLRTLWTPRTIRTIRAIRVQVFICEIISVFPFICPFLLL